MNGLQFFQQADTVNRSIALLLLAMSTASWLVIVCKIWLLRRASGDVACSTAAFWQAASLTEAAQNIKAFDRYALVLPMFDAIKIVLEGEPTGVLAERAEPSQQLTRVLRNALHGVLDKLQFGQVLLASVGATAPFVGLLGTVWGIYQALMGIADAGQISIDRLAGPVGEALLMTAAGLAVAIPAVLAYNILGRKIARIEADLEGFAHDLCALFADAAVKA